MKQRSLKWVLITSLILAMAVPLAVTGTIFTRILADTMKQRIIAVNESLSYSFIDQIDAYLNNALNDLATLRTMVEKQDFEMLNHTSLLDSIRLNKEHFTKIKIINRDGYVRFISPYHRDQINLDLSRNKMFTEPVRTGKPYWSPAFISSDSGHPTVSISIPFENGVMTGFLSLENLSRAAEKIAHEKNIHITITDQTSSFIVHHMETQVYQRGFDPNYARFREKYTAHQLINDVISHHGQDMFVTAGMIPKTEWSIVFYQPVEEVFYPIRLFYIYMVLGFVFLTGITILLCLRHINLVIATIQKFTRSARVIARGQYGEGTLPVQYREFSELSDQFAAMADAVKTRELELRENEERYRSIFIAAQDAILIADARTGQILDVNAFACELFNYPRKRFLRLSMADISARPRRMKRILGQEQSWIPECPLLKSDETRFTAELSISFFTLPDTHTICTIVARDITRRIAEDKEKEQMQKMLGHAQKMEAIGRLAGGIAHDFNNILTAIVGYAELSRTKAPEGSPLVKYTTRVLTAAQRAKELVDQILTFARSSRAEKKPVQV
ncbi:MAG: PAS domain-containing protein, partial [Desulfobacterales bacterium]|nr:PAS domain-containing protein [Desulfobacterales bacterium]